MLSIIRTVITKYKLGAIMALFFLTASCSDDGAKKIAATPVYAATDYFRAIYFIDGPAAQALGDYQQLSISSLTNDAKAIKDVRDFQDRVVQYIGEKNPGFFEGFKTQITSGDYSVVKAAIKDGVNAYMEAVKTLSNQELPEKEISAMAKRYMAKYGAKHMSKSEFASSVKEFSKDVADESAERTADLEGPTKYVTTNYYYYYYVVAGAAVLVVLIVLFDQTDPAIDPIDPPPTLVPVDPDAPETEVSYLFDDYAATITAGMAITE